MKAPSTSHTHKWLTSLGQVCVYQSISFNKFNYKVKVKRNFWKTFWCPLCQGLCLVKAERRQPGDRISIRSILEKRWLEVGKVWRNICSWAFYCRGSWNCSIFISKKIFKCQWLEPLPSHTKLQFSNKTISKHISITSMIYFIISHQLVTSRPKLLLNFGNPFLTIRNKLN